MPAAPCIHDVPGGRSGGSWRCSTNRQRLGVLADGPLEQRVTHGPGGGEQSTGEDWILRVLGCVEKHVADTRCAAAASVVVPEPGAQPSRHPESRTDRRHRWRAPSRDAVHLLHTGMRQGRKELGCPRGAVAPGVGHRLDLTLRRRDGVRYDRCRRPACRWPAGAGRRELRLRPARAGRGPRPRRPAHWRCRPCRGSSWARVTRRRTIPQSRPASSVRQPDQGVRAGGRDVRPGRAADPHGGHDDPAVPITRSWRHRPTSPATSMVVAQPSGTLSSSSRCRACGAAVGDSIRSAVASPANPSYKDGSDRVATIAESRSTTASRSPCSASVHGRTSATSTSTGANRPATPAYSESRSAGGPTDSHPPPPTRGARGPSSSRTWSTPRTRPARRPVGTPPVEAIGAV